MGNQPHTSEHRRRDRILGLTIIVLAFAGCMGLSVWGMRVSTPRPAPEPEPASQDGLPGFPKAVRPLDILGRARSLTVRQKFRGFEVHGLKRDGTLDLTKAGSSLKFVFQSPQGRGPQPVRKPGTLPDRRYCGTQAIVVNSEGITALPDRATAPCGSSEIEDIGTPIGCGLEDLWAVAEKKKIKTRGASVEYFEAASGPAFKIESDRRILVVSARDCNKELKGREQRGTLPR